MNGIIVPTHPKHFHWTNKLLDSAGPEENVIVIFSTEQDYKSFGRKCEYLVVAPKPDYIQSITTYKKLEALKQLQTKYDYLATIDTETIFLRSTTPHLETIWNNNCLIGNISTRDGDQIIKSCLDDVKITNYPYPLNIYYWFNDIQVYPTKLIPQFLDWLPKNIIHDRSFDYLLFGIFMITEHNHKLKIFDAKSIHGIIERLKDHPDCWDLAKEVNWSVWFPGVEKLDNIKMLFHLDRYPIP